MATGVDSGVLRAIEANVVSFVIAEDNEGAVKELIHRWHVLCKIIAPDSAQRALNGEDTMCLKGLESLSAQHKAKLEKMKSKGWSSKLIAVVTRKRRERKLNKLSLEVTDYIAQLMLAIQGTALQDTLEALKRIEGLMSIPRPDRLGLQQGADSDDEETSAADQAMPPSSSIGSAFPEDLINCLRKNGEGYFVTPSLAVKQGIEMAFKEGKLTQAMVLNDPAAAKQILFIGKIHGRYPGLTENNHADGRGPRKEWDSAVSEYRKKAGRGRAAAARAERMQGRAAP